MNWPVFFTRLGSSLVYAVIMLAGLLIPDPFAIIILALLIQFLCLREYLAIIERIFPGVHYSSFFRWVVQFAGVVVIVGLVPFQSGAAIILLPIPLLILLPAMLFRKKAFKAALGALSGLLYISLPMASFIMLRNFHVILPLALVLMIWTNDTMAYITGSLVGKTPLSSISPKKTWEGTIGGGMLTLIGTGIWVWLDTSMDIKLSYLLLIIALIAVIGGTLGDLFESKLKRMAGIKDSGNIMPGHGGALDRLDSLLVSLPFTLFVVAWILA